MKGLVICAVGLCALVSLGAPRRARAEAVHRVVVEPFVGVGSPRLREQTIGALTELGQKVIPDRNVASAAASLGLVQLSDNYSFLARDLNATLFVEGAIIAKGRRNFTAHIKAKNREGVLVGRAAWSGTSVAGMLPRIQRGLAPGLRAILARYPNPDGSAPAEPVAARPRSSSRWGRSWPPRPGHPIRRRPPAWSPPPRRSGCAGRR
jgi:hypothetical protein